MAHLESTSTERYTYHPESVETYGIVVDDRLDSPLIKLGLDALGDKNVDHLVLLCLAPHDIRSRTDWNELERQIRFANGKERDYEVRLIQSPEELLEASLNMRILRLPDDT